MLLEKIEIISIVFSIINLNIKFAEFSLLAASVILIYEVTIKD